MTDIRLALPSPRRTPGREGSPLRPWRGLSAAIAFLGLAGCADDSSTKGDALTAAEVEPIVANYIAIVRASYDDAITGTSALDGAIEAFLDGPSEANLVAARQAWLDVRETYGQTETYRFYDGPIDDPDTGPEGRINGWPLDEAFIDYVVDDDGAGIINHTDDFPMISQQVVADENENGSETNISSGYHAIEFLLWGQDLSATGPGARPYTDYVTGEDGTAANQDRRSAYIAAASGLLLEDLASVRAAWNDGGGTYAAEFAALEPKEAVRRMFAGIGVMAGFELPGERMAA
ncbi:MAG: hypothetical protein KC417_14735, partial [Myxococcales bacterium]|nr:hypothetical protein [Myxococcales bacterium]